MNRRELIKGLALAPLACLAGGGGKAPFVPCGVPRRKGMEFAPLPADAKVIVSVTTFEGEIIVACKDGSIWAVGPSEGGPRLLAKIFA